MIWASWLVNAFINRAKALNTLRWKSALDFHCENFSDTYKFVQKM